jgi:hypothetical protein
MQAVNTAWLLELAWYLAQVILLFVDLDLYIILLLYLLFNVVDLAIRVWY